MIFIDDAGTGCFLGTPVIVGYRYETRQKVVKYMKHPHEVKELSKQILTALKVDKDELILVCRGDYFKGFRSFLKENKYTYKSCVIKDIAQDITEDTFLEHLYSLGVPRQIKLHGKDYKTLDDELVIAVIANPKLLNHFRYRGKQKPRNAMQKIENAIFHYPNLIASLLD